MIKKILKVIKANCTKKNIIIFCISFIFFFSCLLSIMLYTNNDVVPKNNDGPNYDDLVAEEEADTSISEPVEEEMIDDMDRYKTPSNDNEQVETDEEIDIEEPNLFKLDDM